MRKEEDKTIEEFFGELFLGLWAVIHFAIMPVKADTNILATLENLIRSVVFYGLLVGGLWLFCFAHQDEYFFNRWYLIHFFAVALLYFFLRQSLFLWGPEQILKTEKITVDHLKQKNLKFSKLYSLMESEKDAPIGISLISKKPVLLNLKSRVQHLLVSGATGQGKTTLLKTLLNHSLKHGHPVIIIDPKGEKADIREMKEKAKLYGREKDFLLFSLSFPKESLSYNPLLTGTVQQIKARLMDGLRFENEYYKAQSALFLGGILSAFKFLNIPVTFLKLDSYLNNRSRIQILIEKISAKEKTKIECLDRKAEEYNKTIDDLKAVLSQIDRLPAKDLAGLQAQVSSINCLEFRKILSKKEENSKQTISLEECLKKGKIAYFQMNVNGYGEISRQVGRMILQDLKVLSNQIQCGQKTFSYDFCACFIDEFGSFIAPDFVDFLKMARSSRIGIHLFCQGLADLSKVSFSFKDQIVGNTVSKIVFRQDVAKDAEEWAGIAGTFSSKKKTYQISGSENNEEMTGIGSLRDVKEMKIEFDVFKRLSVGQAVLIDKFLHKEDLFHVWRPAL